MYKLLIKWFSKLVWKMTTSSKGFRALHPWGHNHKEANCQTTAASKKLLLIPHKEQKLSVWFWESDVGYMLWSS